MNVQGAALKQQLDDSEEVATASDSLALLSADAAVETKPSIFGVPFGSVTLVHDPRLTAEILEPRSITSIPNTVSWFAGMINVRGNLVPVFDLDVLLTARRSNKRRDRRRIMVIGTGMQAAGLLIEQLPQRVNKDSLTTAGESSLPEILDVVKTKIFTVGDDVWVEIDFEKFFFLLGESVLERDERTNEKGTGAD